MFISTGKLFSRLSLLASRKASFINLPGDTSSADKVIFSRLHAPDTMPVVNHADYGVFLGGNGMYPALRQANVAAHMSSKVPRRPVVGIAFQDVQPGITKL